MPSCRHLLIIKRKILTGLIIPALILPVLLLLNFPGSLHAQQTSQQLKVMSSENVFEDPPFKTCHASTLMALPDGKILCAWFAGTGESNPDVGIWLSQKNNDSWTKPEEVANGIQQNGERLASWNPVLFQPHGGKILLFYKVGKNPREWWGECKTSKDSGLTWSPARKLPDGFLGPIKNKPIQLRNGNILYPSSVESMTSNTWTVHVERSDSEAEHWEKIDVDCDTFDVIQPSFLIHGGDTLQMLCRSRQNMIAQSWSYDNGTTWTKMSATNLPNPNSGSDAVTLADGKQLLVYNPLLAGKNWWEGRSVLKVGISSDGVYWSDAYTLEDHAKGEYSYPAVIQANDGLIHISYTLDRKNIRHVVLKEVSGK